MHLFAYLFICLLPQPGESFIRNMTLSLVQLLGPGAQVWPTKLSQWSSYKFFTRRCGKSFDIEGHILFCEQVGKKFVAKTDRSLEIIKYYSLHWL